jgi:hypothetical protein
MDVNNFALRGFNFNDFVWIYRYLYTYASIFVFKFAFFKKSIQFYISCGYRPRDIVYVLNGLDFFSKNTGYINLNHYVHTSKKASITISD